MPPRALARGARISLPRVWFAALLSSICLEGIGRKFIPGVPQFAWYFLKDGVLLAGVISFGVGITERREARWLYRGFAPFLLFSIVWTVLESLNRGQTSLVLALVGLRAYWLWWIAPVVIASVLRREEDRRAAVSVLAAFAIAIAILAAVQFQFPGEAAINGYAWANEDMGIAQVAETGRVRVTSTFSYITGFADFGILALALLLALGLGEGRGIRKVLCFAGAAALAATLPMSGSRGPVVLGAGAAAAVVLGAGFLRSREGRGILAAAGLLGAAGWLAAPEAVAGVESRFAYSDTRGRFTEVLQALPPVALAENEYPVLGIGTGMQQNARAPLRVRTDWESEGEAGRYLIELGPVGYLLVWMARLGLAWALMRAMSRFRRGGQRALAGASLAYAVLTMLGNLTFDHVWQALYFTGLGLILQGAVTLRTRERASASLVAAHHRVDLARGKRLA